MTPLLRARGLVWEVKRSASGCLGGVVKTRGCDTEPRVAITSVVSSNRINLDLHVVYDLPGYHPSIERSLRADPITDPSSATKETNVE